MSYIRIFFICVANILICINIGFAQNNDAYMISDFIESGLFPNQYGYMCQDSSCLDYSAIDEFPASFDRIQAAFPGAVNRYYEHAPATNASRTMLFDIRKNDWDDTLLDALNIPRAVLPRVTDTSGVIGMLDPSILGRSIPVAALCGDQHSALFGQGCFEPGMMKNTYGTGCFLLMNTGDQPAVSQNGLVSTIAWRLNGTCTYALEGSVFVAGAAIQWLRDEMKIIERASETETIARSLPDNGGVYMVPTFTGLGAPYWDPYARGAVLGLTRGANKNHLVRATLESMAYQTKDLIDAMTEDLGGSLTALKVDGGASANNFLMQFQADVLDCEVKRPQCIETTSLGAAYLAGLATGYWESKEDVLENWQVERSFTPRMEEAQKTKLLRGWKKAVRCVRGWAKDEA